MYLKLFTDIYKSHGFDFKEAKEEISFVLDVLFNYTYKDFLSGKKLDDNQILQAVNIFEERVLSHKPIQQITGKAFFYGYSFFINEFTLIPRPETELLVNEVLDYSKKLKNPEILDLGTGSGCIALTLKLKNSNIRCDMTDIQSQALEIAKKNSLSHNILDGVRFIKSDIFDNVDKKYNVIVSNPPYIPRKEKDNLQTEVRNFESPVALFANDDDGIEFYKKIISNAKSFLKEEGMLAFEIGINQAAKVKNILYEYKFTNIKIIKDFNSIERIITATNY